jgi:adenosine deaminase
MAGGRIDRDEAAETGPPARPPIDLESPGDVENPGDTEARRPWLERLPKVELHLHLEGAIPHDALWALIRKYGGDPAVSGLESLPGVFRYRDFPDFIDRWVWKQGFLRDRSDFEAIGAAVAADLARQRILYAEVFYSPTDTPATKLSVQEISVALRAGLASVSGVEVALITDLVRDQGPERGARTLEAVAEVAAEAGVIGIGIGGSEQSFPPEPFAAVYRRARAVGLRTTAHAGEVAGPASIWGAIRVLEVDRIDHGTRAVEDPGLMAFLAERRIPVTSCPGSNVATGAVPSLAAHPIRLLVDAGLLVSVNTDDPAMFGLSLAGEYAALQRGFGFSDDEIRGLVLGAVESSWLSADRKAALRASLVADPAWAG